MRKGLTGCIDISDTASNSRLILPAAIPDIRPRRKPKAGFHLAFIDRNRLLRETGLGVYMRTQCYLRKGAVNKLAQQLKLFCS